LRELRVDTERAGHNVLELRFFDPNRPPLRIHERECEVFEAPTAFRIHRLNAHEVERAFGELHVSCPRHDLEVHAFYRGCEG
jgi:hypothetical protein